MKGFWRRLRNHVVPHKDNAYRPHLLRRGWLVFFLAVMLGTEGFLVASLVARQSGNNFLAAVLQSNIVSLVNQERVQNDSGVLIEDPQLDAAAQAKANDMAAKGYFSHTGPDGKTPWQWIDGSGYQYQYAGENLAVRFVDSVDVVNAWMASPTHHANIVKSVYTQTGVGIAEGTYEGQPATFVVQYFGTPAVAAAPAVVEVAVKTPAATTSVLASGVAGVSAPESPAVLGAESQSMPAAQIVAPVPSPAHGTTSFMQSVMRAFARLLSDPRSSVGWIFGGVAVLLLLVVSLTFLLHIHIQPTRMLLSGVVVAGIAVFFLTFNNALLSATTDQAASVTQAGSLTTVIDDMATSTP